MMLLKDLLSLLPELNKVTSLMMITLMLLVNSYMINSLICKGFQLQLLENVSGSKSLTGEWAMVDFVIVKYCTLALTIG